MKVLLIIVITSIFSNHVKGQELYGERRLYTIDRKYEGVPVLFFVDNKIFRQYEYHPRDYLKRMFIDDKALDSTRLDLDLFLKSVNVPGRIYGVTTLRSSTRNEFGRDYENVIYEIDFTINAIKKVGSFKNMHLATGDGHYYTRERYNDSILYKIEPSTGKRTVFTSTVPYVLDTGEFATGAHIFNFLEFSNIWQLSTTNYIMQFADCSADCNNYRYLLYDHANKTYSKIARLDSIRQRDIKLDRTKGHYETSLLWLDVFMRDLSNNYSYVSENSYTSGTVEEYVVDAEARLVTRALKKHDFRPYNNYQAGKIVSVMAHTSLDNRKKVFVPYKFTLPLERSFYNVFNDQELLKEDLDEFGEYELSIIKNFVFAKHNYDFESEFYQAFFNLFAFYNTDANRKTRTKGVNDKLTDIDKINLSAINKALRKNK